MLLTYVNRVFRSVSLVALYDRLYLLIWSVLSRSFHSDTCLTPTIDTVSYRAGIDIGSYRRGIHTTSNKPKPILRLRGGVGEEEKEEQNMEETGGRFILTTLDEEESEEIGGKMEHAKLPGMIRISGCNPNGTAVKAVKIP
jgi:hypothetical protein